jgi:hypothetical protein
VKALRATCAPRGKLALITSRKKVDRRQQLGRVPRLPHVKAALNAAGMSLAHDLRAEESPSHSLYSGYARADMTDHHGHVNRLVANEGSSLGWIDRSSSR